MKEVGVPRLHLVVEAFDCNHLKEEAVDHLNAEEDLLNVAVGDLQNVVEVDRRSGGELEDLSNAEVDHLNAEVDHLNGEEDHLNGEAGLRNGMEDLGEGLGEEDLVGQLAAHGREAAKDLPSMKKC